MRHWGANTWGNHLTHPLSGLIGSCFHLLTLMDNVALNSYMQVFVHGFNSFGHNPSMPHIPKPRSGLDLSPAAEVSQAAWWGQLQRPRCTTSLWDWQCHLNLPACSSYHSYTQAGGQYTSPHFLPWLAYQSGHNVPFLPTGCHRFLCSSLVVHLIIFQDKCPCHSVRTNKSQRFGAPLNLWDTSVIYPPLRALSSRTATPPAL